MGLVLRPDPVFFLLGNWLTGDDWGKHLNRLRGDELRCNVQGRNPHAFATGVITRWKKALHVQFSRRDNTFRNPPWAFVSRLALKPIAAVKGLQKILLCHASLNQHPTSLYPAYIVCDWFLDNVPLGHRSSVVDWSPARNIAPVVQLMRPGSGTLLALSMRFVHKHHTIHHIGVCRWSTQLGHTHFYSIDDPSRIKKKVRAVDLHPFISSSSAFWLNHSQHQVIGSWKALDTLLLFVLNLVFIIYLF